jgi:SMODS-associated and fused to various effectors sensor domain
MEFWNWLSRTDNILGVLTTFFAGYAAYRLRRQSQQLIALARQAPRIGDFLQLLKAHEGVKSISPVAFALTLLPDNDSIKNHVQTFLDVMKWKMPIEELNMNGFNNAQDLETFVNQLRKKKREFVARGYTEVHLFITGPVQAGVLIGAIYDNWIPVKLYHKPKAPPPQIYEYWMPLTY